MRTHSLFHSSSAPTMNRGDDGAPTTQDAHRLIDVLGLWRPHIRAKAEAILWSKAFHAMSMDDLTLALSGTCRRELTPGEYADAMKEFYRRLDKGAIEKDGEF